MGGTLAVTIRQANGTINKMARWTNAMPFFICNLKLVKEDPAHLQNYLQKFDEMRADYLAHKDDQKFEFPMSDCYGNHVYLAPTGYGLVVVDYQTKQILTMQGYSWFESTSLAGFINAIESKEKEEIQQFKDLANAQRLYFQPDFKGSKQPIKDFAELQAIVKQQLAIRTVRGLLHFDLSPWKIIRFNESAAGLAKFKKTLRELGFVLTKEEQGMWKEYAKAYRA
jgi:hypothetical protein